MPPKIRWSWIYCVENAEVDCGMHDIRFRAWDAVEKKMVRVTSLSWEYPSGLEVNGSNVSLPEHLMQFTGLTDRHGKEIWEGDVVKWECREKTYQNRVYWDEAYAMFQVKNFYDSGQDSPCDAFSEDCKFEVLGNLYEHPKCLDFGPEGLS